MTVFDAPARRREPPHPVLWLLVGVMAALHALEAGAEAGFVAPLFGQAEMRATFGFSDAAFDAALAGRPHPPQLYWSFATHAFLHGGWLHLAMNSAILLAIGHGVCRAAGPWAMLAIFLVSTVAGAATLGLTVETRAVLVGASGGVFGLLGAVLVRRARTLAQRGMSRAPVRRMVIALILAHILIFGFETVGGGGFAGGDIAWQSHLGGFVAGWLTAAPFTPRAGARPEDRPDGTPR